MNINKKEFEFLNDKPKHPKLKHTGNALYYILKGFLEAVYIITCIICTIIEVIAWVFCIFTLPTRRRRYKRRKRWY